MAVSLGIAAERSGRQRPFDTDTHVVALEYSVCGRIKQDMQWRPRWPQVPFRQTTGWLRQCVSAQAMFLWMSQRTGILITTAGRQSKVRFRWGCQG